MRYYLLTLSLVSSILYAQEDATTKLARIQNDKELFAFFYDKNMDVEQIRYYTRENIHEVWKVAEVFEFSYDDNGTLQEQVINKVSGGKMIPEYKVTNEKQEDEAVSIRGEYLWNSRKSSWQESRRTLPLGPRQFRYWELQDWNNEWNVRDITDNISYTTTISTKTYGSTTYTYCYDRNCALREALPSFDYMVKRFSSGKLQQEQHTKVDPVLWLNLFDSFTSPYSERTYAYKYDIFGLVTDISYEEIPKVDSWIYPNLRAAIEKDGEFLFCPERYCTVKVFHDIFSHKYYCYLVESSQLISFYECTLIWNKDYYAYDVLLGDVVGSWTLSDDGGEEYVDNSLCHSLEYNYWLKHVSNVIVDDQEYTCRFLATKGHNKTDSSNPNNDVHCIRAYWRNGATYPSITQQFWTSMDDLSSKNLTEIDERYYTNYFDDEGRLIGRHFKDQYSTYGYDENGLMNFTGGWVANNPANYVGTAILAHNTCMDGLFEEVTQTKTKDGIWRNANFVCDRTANQTIVTSYDLSDLGRKKTLNSRLVMTDDDLGQCENYQQYDADGNQIVNCKYVYDDKLQIGKLAGNRNGLISKFINDYIYEVGIYEEENPIGRKFCINSSLNCYDVFSRRFGISLINAPKQIGSYTFYYEDACPNYVYDTNGDGRLSISDIAHIITHRYQYNTLGGIVVQDETITPLSLAEQIFLW